MELKRLKGAILRTQKNLLIVPYGIETGNSCNRNKYLSVLLIVPYGIET